MAASLTASLVLALLVFSVSVSADQRTITAKPGDKATLTCGEVQNTDVKVVEWSRPDLESEKLVLLYRPSQSHPEGQSPFFKDRVDLQDVKKGNVSLVLKNVTTDDTGTYECRVLYTDDNSHKKVQDTDPISTINLRVEAAKKCEAAANQGNTSRRRRSVQDTDSNCNNPGNKENGRSWPGLIAGLSVCAVVALLLVGAVLYKRSREKLSTHQHGGFFSAAVRDV